MKIKFYPKRKLKKEIEGIPTLCHIDIVDFKSVEKDFYK